MPKGSYPKGTKKPSKRRDPRGRISDKDLKKKMQKSSRRKNR